MKKENKSIKVSVEAYIYLLNILHSENEKRNNRIRNNEKYYDIEYYELDADEYNLEQIKKLLEKANLEYEETITESIYV